PPDRVWAPWGGGAGTGRAWQAGYLPFPGLCFYLRALAQGQVPASAEIPARPHAGEAQRDQGGASTANAPGDPRTRALAGAGRQGLFRLPCRAAQRRGTQRLPLPYQAPLVAHAAAPQSEGSHYVGADDQAGQ